jgi:hypothetical protein
MITPTLKTSTLEFCAAEFKFELLTISGATNPGVPHLVNKY